MRKRRQVLQVSTFPFLAVLLCTMGSLILLLLVIDRQAKAAARNKARLAAAEVAAKAAAKQQQHAADIQAEQERRRAELHGQLARQRDELLSGVQVARGKVDATARDVEAEEARSRELHRRLDAELARLLATQGELTARRAEAAQVGEKAEGVKGQRVRLAEELAQMERAIQALKELREREKQTYSLVPYKGRRGDSRRPLYLECSAAGITFHPDHLTLLGAGELRAEVERRAAARRQEDTGKTAADPYLLMLVRPDGIVNYYRALAALDGLKVGLGYEFIDTDWALDFSADEDATKAQPWMVAQPSGALPGQGPLPRPPRGVVPPAKTPSPDDFAEGSAPDGLPRPSAVLKSLPMAVGGKGPARSQSPSASEGVADSLPAARAPAQPLSEPERQRGGSGYPRWRSGSDSAGTGAAPGAVAGLGLPDYGPARASPSGEGVPGPVVANGSRQVLGSPGIATPGPTEGAGGSRPGETGTSPAGGSGSPGVGLPTGGGTWRPSGEGKPGLSGPGGAAGEPGGTGPFAAAQNAKEPARGTPLGQAAGAAPGTGTPGNGTSGDRATGQPGASVGPGQTGGKPSPGSPTAAAQGPRAGKVGSSDATSGQASDGGGEAPLPRLLQPPPSAGRGPTRPAPPPLSRLIGNRDWIIAIECKADAVVIQPWGQRFPVATTPAGQEPPLVQAVRQLIARRQATVRSGEPPYRPLIRFQVHPDGQRSYYFAYPLLEVLRIPMSRENLE